MGWSRMASNIDKDQKKKGQKTNVKDFSYHNINPAIRPVNWGNFQVEGHQGSTNLLDGKYQD